MISDFAGGMPERCNFTSAKKICLPYTSTARTARFILVSREIDTIIAYDVDTGMLLNGKRKLQGTGRYYCCTPSKTIIEIESYEDNNGILINASMMEEALYEFCIFALNRYIEEGNNL